MSADFEALMKVARLHGSLEYLVFVEDSPDDDVKKALRLVYEKLDSIFQEWKDSKEVE